MNEAADKALEVFSLEIALSLANKTIDGDTTSAKLLFALADGQIDCEDESMMQSLLSLAERLAAEPEYSDEMVVAGPEDSTQIEGREW